MQQKWSVAITQRPVIESLEKQRGAKGPGECCVGFVEETLLNTDSSTEVLHWSVLFSKAHLPTRLWKQNIGDGTTAWQTAVRHLRPLHDLLQMSWRTASPKFVARLWNREDFFRCEWPHFPRSSIEWPVFSAGPWEVVTSRASLGWTQSWCWTYRQTEGYLVLDILIPGGGKDFLNPVGISEKIMQKHTEREREIPTHTKRATIHYWLNIARSVMFQSSFVIDMNEASNSHQEEWILIKCGDIAWATCWCVRNDMLDPKYMTEDSSRQLKHRLKA